MNGSHKNVTSINTQARFKRKERHPNPITKASIIWIYITECIHHAHPSASILSHLPHPLCTVSPSTSYESYSQIIHPYFADKKFDHQEATSKVVYIYICWNMLKPSFSTAFQEQAIPEQLVEQVIFHHFSPFFTIFQWIWRDLIGVKLGSHTWKSPGQRRRGQSEGRSKLHWSGGPGPHRMALWYMILHMYCTQISIDKSYYMLLLLLYEVILLLCLWVQYNHWYYYVSAG